jgi:bifunctional diaminopimelate decarboxylase / aspartate kinase
MFFNNLESSMQNVVIKFGGTSVSSIQSWQNIKTICENHINSNKRVLLVCSAFSQVSNQLEKAITAAKLNQHQHILSDVSHAYQHLCKAMGLDFDSLLKEYVERLAQLLHGVSLLKEATPRVRAQILSFGELMMSHLGCAFLNQQGIACHWLDAQDALKSVKSKRGNEFDYLSAIVPCDKDDGLIKQIDGIKARVVITQGFIASNSIGETVLLGRGGSDTSASTLAAKLDATDCEIWTDVPGIYSANPHQIPQARLLKQLNYDEAQEIATMGAKVLHPNSIGPVRDANIPLWVKYTKLPEHAGTKISHVSDEKAPPIKSIQTKHGVILISINTLSMWQQVGFLADIFQCFKQHGFSVDLLSTSESNITLSLDALAKLKERDALVELLDDLNRISHAKLIEPCACVSLVGHNIRTVLHELGPTLEVFEQEQVHMMSLASNDLNLNFVVNDAQADKLTQKLHALLIENNPVSFYYSKTWQEQFGQEKALTIPWWQVKQSTLEKIAKQSSPCFVYDKKTLCENASNLIQLKSIDRLFFAVKANPFEKILTTFYTLGLGFECVSLGEIEHVLSLFPDIDRKRILFTPNFASKHEYQYALSLDIHITIDSLYPLTHWPELFSGHNILLRIDPGSGAGHHKYVITGGSESKFGIPQTDLEQIASLCTQHNIHIKGLHAHFGSGILKPDIWQQTAKLLTEVSSRFPELSYINLGGGLGIVERPGQHQLDLKALDDSLMPFKQLYPKLEFWLEPGRYLVAQSGVLLAKVTQTKQKSDINFIGIETGMNSLIRPALYGSYHEIVNLTRLDDNYHQIAHIVGPICESGDTLGYSRMMPKTKEDDVVLIANAGAYGHSMSSNYNLRPPAIEVLVD